MKKRMFKKMTAVLLVLALLPIFSLFTMAEDDIVSGTWGDLSWTLDQNTGVLVISGEGEMADLYSNSAWCKYKTVIKSVVIENGVTSIGSSAFGSCTLLTSINIPNSVTSIGDGAFHGCSSLTSITIPNSVTSIGENAFGYCSLLSDISVNDGNSVYHAAGNCLIQTETKTLIAGCQSSVIPTDDSVTSIGDYAFFACDSLTSITVPDNITSIGFRAFNSCTLLTSITIGNGVTSISDEAFENCSSLTSINIPNSIENIGSRAFGYDNDLLEEIIFFGTEDEWNLVGKAQDWNLYNIPVLFHPNHTWNAGVVTTEPTETTDGLKTYTCPECGMIKTEVLEKLGSSSSGGSASNGGSPSNSGITSNSSPESTETTGASEIPTVMGCGSALDSTYAILALVAILGVAFVAKKKENE